MADQVKVHIPYPISARDAQKFINPMSDQNGLENHTAHHHTLGVSLYKGPVRGGGYSGFKVTGMIKGFFGV